MDALNDPHVEQIVVMSSAQVGKTEVLLNISGYYIHQDPSPILLLQPTLDMAKAFSKDRLAPMVRDTPALRGKVKDARSRDSDNTILHKQFPGGHITIAGANSPASLASRPIRVVLCDEVDRYPPSVGTEGDPVNLARKRTATFHNRRIVLTSTPTTRHFSRIETAYEQSDRRHYLVPCPACGHRQRLTWELVRWPDGAPDEAAIHCGECDARWSEAQRQKAIAHGQWQATADFRGVAGFHLSELYSPWSTPADVALSFLEAKAGGPELLKTWVNTSLGESWEEEGEGVEPHVLERRVEDWGELAPAEVLAVTIGVDVQADRLELEIVGWGVGEESWSLDYQVLIGEPVNDEVWQELAEIATARISTADGRSLTPAGVVVDSGYLPKRVYAFTRGRRYAWPGKGMAGPGRPVAETGLRRLRRQARSDRTGDAKPEPIGVDEAKAILYRRLSMSTPGPGYCHFPARDTEYFLQLTGEKRVQRYRRGVPYPAWIATRPRVEALDCRVYAYAALLLSGQRLQPPPPPTDKPDKPPSAGAAWVRPRGGWINRRT
jgi:phage terminase large subunit GpA-like protein